MGYFRMYAKRIHINRILGAFLLFFTFQFHFSVNGLCMEKKCGRGSGGAVIRNYSWSEGDRYAFYEVDDSCFQARYQNKESFRRQNYLRNSYDTASSGKKYSKVSPQIKKKSGYAKKSKRILTKKSNIRKNHSRSLRQKKRHTLTAKKYKYHKVRKGDTLYRISRRYNVSVQQIVSVNRINRKNVIKKGVKLRIPLNLTGKKVSVHKSRKKRVTKKKPGKKGRAARKKPVFRWPVKKIVKYKRDGMDGVKSIGVIITSSAGSQVYSSAAGVVKRIGNLRGFGNYIVIVHKGRYATVYSNLDLISVSMGQRVRTGKGIGRIGRHQQKLHFQIDYSGKPENPLKHLPAKG